MEECVVSTQKATIYDTSHLYPNQEPKNIIFDFSIFSFIFF